MSCELFYSSPALSWIKWLNVDALQYKIITRLFDQTVVWSQDAVAVRVVTHSC